MILFQPSLNPAHPKLDWPQLGYSTTATLPHLEANHECQSVNRRGMMFRLRSQAEMVAAPAWADRARVCPDGAAHRDSPRDNTLRDT